MQIEMSGICREIQRFERTSALLMYGVEALYQFYEVAHFGVGSAPPAMIEIRHEGGPADRRKNRMILVHDEVPLRVTRPESETLRRLR